MSVLWCTAGATLAALILSAPPPRAVVRLQLGPSALPPLAGGGASTLLFQDSKKSMTARAVKEKELIEPNTRQMKLPTKRKSTSKRKGGGGGGGGFGASAGPSRSAAQQLHDLRVDTIKDDGVCLVPGVLSRESGATLYDCVADELARAYAAVDADPETCLGRFNVPIGSGPASRLNARPTCLQCSPTGRSEPLGPR